MVEAGQSGRAAEVVCPRLASCPSGLIWKPADVMELHPCLPDSICKPNCQKARGEYRGKGRWQISLVWPRVAAMGASELLGDDHQSMGSSLHLPMIPLQVWPR